MPHLDSLTFPPSQPLPVSKSSSSKTNPAEATFRKVNINQATFEHGLSFDHFSRTSQAANRHLTQEIFGRLDAAGHIEARTIKQAYSPTDDRFLPDRSGLRRYLPSLR